jgi:hypothetical protein
MRSEDQLLLANKSTRRSRGLLFDNTWSSDRTIYGCLSSLAKHLHEGYTADYFLNRMKTNALFSILFIQNNLLKKKIRYRHFLCDYCTVCILEKFYRVIFLFSSFDWSIFVKQLVAKHMKEIICRNNDISFIFPDKLNLLILL